MIRTVLLLSSLCGLVTSSGVHGDGLAHLAPVAAIGPAPAAGAPVVTAASSQYFQRTFNRLVVPQAVAPVAPPPLQPVFTVAPAPPVFVEPTREVPVAVNPPPTQPAPVHPNVAIAVATAHAAAPVATILLPPYPFGFPPNFGLIPQEQPVNVPDENNKEPTTQSTTQAEVTTQEPEQTTPIPSSSDDNFVQQALPSNEDVNFNQYGPPLPPQDQQFPPNNPGPQFQPNQPRPQFPQQQPQPQFPQQQPRPQFQPQQPRPQFQPQQPQLGQFPLQQSRPPFQPQQPQGQFPPQQPRPQYQPQQPEFPPQRPQGQFPPHQSQPQFPPQQPRPQYQPLPQAQQPRPQFQPQARPQQPRPTYGAPQQPWPQQRARPQKLRTSVEVVPVPLAYITPPPPQKTHAHVKVVKHIYTFVPATPAKIIVRPVVQTRPLRLVKIKKVHSQNLRANARDIEVTTFSPFPRPNIKPPKV